MLIYKMSYKQQLKNPLWELKRNKIFKRDGFKCVKCRISYKIQCHHKKYIDGNMAWDVPDSFLETLCEKCHKIEHKGRHIKTFVVKTTKSKQKRYIDLQAKKQLKKIIKKQKKIKIISAIIKNSSYTNMALMGAV